MYTTKDRPPVDLKLCRHYPYKRPELNVLSWLTADSQRATIIRAGAVLWIVALCATALTPTLKSSLAPTMSADELKLLEAANELRTKYVAPPPARKPPADCGYRVQQNVRGTIAPASSLSGSLECP